eukprot:UN28418
MIGELGNGLKFAFLQWFLVPVHASTPRGQFRKIYFGNHRQLLKNTFFVLPNYTSVLCHEKIFSEKSLLGNMSQKRFVGLFCHITVAFFQKHSSS